jgi:4-diphosphocytidyl-2-C-methyl-D-erythritol kinase
VTTRGTPRGTTHATTRVAIRAQAKLNLWLRVLAKEESGYHTIETLFHRIELADEVAVTLTSGGDRTIACSEDVGPAQENLAYRAAQLYCEMTDWATGFHIGINKRIPASGGLGGGSADAAATLLALNAMSPRPQDAAELAEMGTQIGADVPFLLTEAAAALAWGHGNRILTLRALPQKHVALVVPPFGLSTAEVYQSGLPGHARSPERLSIGDLADWTRIATMAGNDLGGSPVVRRHSQLASAVAALRAAGAIMAEMTGSGSVLFGIFDSRPDAAALAQVTGCRVVLTKTALNVEALRRLD